jgi:hypothetical protein
LWTYHYEGAMLRYFQNWINQLRWQRLVPFQNLAFMLLDHSDGILNYCRTKVRFGVVEASNGNIKTLFRRGRGYKNLAYLLLKAQRTAVTKAEFIVLQKAAQNARLSEFSCRAEFQPLRRSKLSASSIRPRQLVCGGAKEPRRWFEPLFKDAKVSNFSWHCLRHTFASRLVMAGVDIRTVQELLGHKTISMTVRYSHLAPKLTRAAGERLDAPTETPTDTTDTRVFEQSVAQTVVLHQLF